MEQRRNYFNTRYGGENWMKAGGFVQSFLQAEGGRVLLPHDSDNVVKDMIEKHKDSWDFNVSIVELRNNPLVVVSKTLPNYESQNKYTHKGELKYYSITANPKKTRKKTRTSIPNYAEEPDDKPKPRIVQPHKVGECRCVDTSGTRWKLDIPKKRGEDKGSMPKWTYQGWFPCLSVKKGRTTVGQLTHAWQTPF